MRPHGDRRSAGPCHKPPPGGAADPRNGRDKSGHPPVGKTGCDPPDVFPSTRTLGVHVVPNFHPGVPRVSTNHVEGYKEQRPRSKVTEYGGFK